MRDKWDLFFHENKRQCFLLVKARNAEYTRNSKFVITLQYLKKEGRDDIDFLQVDKHQTILMVSTINLGGMARPAQITQNNQFASISQKSQV